MTGRSPRLKWHMLRRRSSDPAFQRANLNAALAAGAACEIDVVFSADGHALCLHDLTLDRETTGTGSVAALGRSDIASLRQRDSDGRPLEEPPLFLDEVVDTVRAVGSVLPGLVQLDLKIGLDQLSNDALRRLGHCLGEIAPAFVVGGTDWEVVSRIASAAPGIARGFDPLGLYPRSMGLTSDGFRALGAYTFAIAPVADIFYLEASLVLAAERAGVNLIDEVSGNGALVDAWTVDPGRPGLRDDLARLIAVGCGQITTNDPEGLGPILEEIAHG